jgi:glycerol-1-phosphate dehydrogenase [NAD(P)+]
MYSDSAILQVPDILARYTSGRKVAVLMDLRTSDVAGLKIADALKDSGWNATTLIVPDSPGGETPICDDITYEMLLPKARGVDIILPVGSGVLSDLGKWLAGDLGLPYVAFATAASMNGYTSANVATILKGVKSLHRVQPPKAVVSDPEIIRHAPYELTTAGLGDILAKSVSSTDWRMNHILFDEYYCERSVSLIADIEPLYMNHPEDILNRKPDAIEALLHGLLLTGVAMTMVGTSSPASGAEHLISHTLDMMYMLNGQPHDLHGRQVGVGTIISSAIYQEVLEIESPEFRVPGNDINKKFWGKIGDAVQEQYEGKMDRLQQACDILSKKDAWDNLRQELSSMVRKPEVIQDCLKKAKAAYRAEDLGCNREHMIRVVINAHEFRTRFTILDLARLVGMLPEGAYSIVEQWF